MLETPRRGTVRAPKIISRKQKARREVVGAGAKLFCPHERLLTGRHLAVAFNFGFKPHEVAEIRRIILERRAEIVERWLERGRNEG